MLQVDSVSFTYEGRPARREGAAPGAPRLVLDSVGASVARGGLVGILGPNGSGKTTLLRLMSGTLRPLRGRVLLDGTPLERFPRAALARRIAVVPQETRLAFDYTVLEIALMGRYPHLGTFELEGPHDLAIAREALAATGTADLEARSFRTLSGGEKQRVIIASALAQSADLLLLDEPTASLDLGFQLEIAALLDSLNRERGITMVISTHDLNLAASLCREAILLRGGRVLASGETAQALTSDAIRRLYDVEADVRFHDLAKHLTVVPIRRTSRDARP